MSIVNQAASYPNALFSAHMSMINALTQPLFSASQQLAELNLRKAKEASLTSAEAVRNVVVGNDYAKLVELAGQFGNAKSPFFDDYRQHSEHILETLNEQILRTAIRVAATPIEGETREPGLLVVAPEAMH